MALLTTFVRDEALRNAVLALDGAPDDLAPTPSWNGAARLVRERPVSALLAELEAFGSPRRGEAELARMRDLFPHTGLIVFAPARTDPRVLFRLGVSGVDELVLLRGHAFRRELRTALARVARRGTAATVVRALSPYLSRRYLQVVGRALDRIHERPGADDFARAFGLSRPHLSECLKARSLPSVGHLLIWARLLHAGRWLGEPGRSGESVARQLEYHDGAAFRRALRRYVEATPTEIREAGGLDYVLGRFMDRCGFREPDAGARVSVA